MVGDGRIERLWRREGLKVPSKQPKRGRLWLNGGSCVRLRAERTNHVWSYDFVHHRTDDGRAFRMLNILDEYSRECLVIGVKRKLNSIDVIDVLTDLFIYQSEADRIIDDVGFDGEDTISLARVTLANSFAAALLMPYGRLLPACETERYDIELISHRFGVSYEQAAHRMCTLQRPGGMGRRR